MKKWFAASLALVSLAAAPLAADPVWVPVVAPQGTDGRVIATRLRISSAEGAEKPYLATKAGLIQVEASQDRGIDTVGRPQCQLHPWQRLQRLSRSQ